MSLRKSIFFLVEGPLNSPSCFRVIGISTSLVNLNVDVSIICDDRTENSSKIVSLREAGITVHTINSRPRIYGVLQCRSILNLYKPDWVVQLNATLNGFLRLFFSSHKVIVEWDEPAILAPQGFIQKFLVYFLYFWLKNRAKFHISCTKAFLKYLPENSVYIPHGQYIDNEYSVSQVEVGNYFAYLGNFYPLWDHKLIIESVRRASENGYTPEIVMIGGGPEIDKWKNYSKIHNLTNIKFTGYLEFSQMFQMLRGASALLFPMSDTPLNQCRCSTKIFAYLAAKRPVVAHRVGEVVELISNAHFVNPGDDLLDALRKVNFKEINVNPEVEKISYRFLAQVFFNTLEEIQHKNNV